MGLVEEFLKKADDASDRLDLELGMPGGKALTPHVQEIIAILSEDQLLAEWALKAIKTQKARIAEATLRALYGDEEFERMRDETPEIKKNRLRSRDQKRRK